MNVKRFTARTSREALALVKQAFGDEAVVMSTRPCAEGVEVLAMAPESIGQLERVGLMPAARSTPPAAATGTGATQRVLPARSEPPLEHRPVTAPTGSVDEDVDTLAMSTLSFQDFVRDRMLKRRQSELAEAEAASRPRASQAGDTARARLSGGLQPGAADAARAHHREPPVLREEIRLADAAPREPAMQRGPAWRRTRCARDAHARGHGRAA